MALPTLTLLGAAIGRSRVRAVNDDWLEPPRLWAAVVSPSGTMKSPTMKFCCQWIKDKQKILDVLSVQEMPPEEERPRMQTLWVDNVTIESLGPLFRKNPRGMIALPDEMSAWVKRMGQYKGAYGSADEKDFLSIWNGDPIRVDRKTAGSIKTGDTFLAMYSSIQPEVLAKLNPDVLMVDGFMARMLLVEPPIIPVKASLTSTPIHVKHQLWEIFERLYNLDGFIHDTTHSYTPQSLLFAPEVGEMWKTWHDDHCEYSVHPDTPSFLRAPFSKMRGYSVSLALILQLATDPASRLVERVAVENAIYLIDHYFRPHVERLYPRILHGSDIHEMVLERVRQMDQGGGVTHTNLLRSMHMETFELKRVMDTLVERESVVKVKGTGRGWKYVLVGEEES